MQPQKTSILASILLPLALLSVLAGCGSGGPLGGIINVPSASRAEFSGTVDRVDTGDRRISIDDRDGGLRDVYYDGSSVVQYQGERYEPNALQRGDEVTVVARRDGDRYFAETITVTYDVSSGRDGRDDRDSRSTDVLRGVIEEADYHDRRLDVRLSSIDGASSRRTESIYWDEDSDIERDGRDYDVRSLRAGDEVEVRAQRQGDDYYAQRLELLRRVSDTDRDEPSDVRGTVARVDTAARRIDLQDVVTNQLRETDDRRPRTVYYDSSTEVEYQGRRYTPDALERGDEIAVDGHNEGSRFLADRIVVTYNARGN